MAQNFANTPASTADANGWTPSMPNSDLWTLKPARDAPQLLSPNVRALNPNLPRRVVALATSPLGRFPPLTAHVSVVTAGSARIPTATPFLQHQPLSNSDIPPSLQSPSSRAAIGLGHPSTSKRRSAHLEADSAASSTQASPQKRPRVNSSTIKRRTKRFTARTLHTITEYQPVTGTQGSTPRPVPGAPKRSYAQAASPAETSKQSTDRRLTTTPASPTFTPGSPRSASKQLGGPFVSLTALAPRYTSSRAPQAGPTQVQSPRLLFPATMAGSPLYQSLDGTVLAITAAMSEERREVEEKELEDVIYGEDGLVKLRVQTQLRIRFAARKLKLF